MIPERLRPILDEVRPLAQRFDAAGHRLYLVGGIVRDAVLGRPLGADIDLTTDARPDRTTALVSGWADAVWDQGARFGTVGPQEGRHGVRGHHPPRRGLLPRTRASPM